MFKKSKSRFPTFRQLDRMDCGPACIKIISEHYGKNIDFKKIKDSSYLTKQGVSLAGIISAAENIGFDTMPVKVTYKELLEKVNLPCIIHWNNNHFIVVYKVTVDNVFVSDPKNGLQTYSTKKFRKGWLNKNTNDGVLLLLEPTNYFYDQTKFESTQKSNVFFLKNYFRPYTKLIFQLIVGLLLSSAIQVTLPFLTKALVDYGINNQSIKFVYLILLAQVVFFIALTFIGIIRSWILLHITTRINIKLVSDFLHKLLKLPIAYFETKQRGDLLQRIQDHKRIDRLISANTLNVLFGTVNIFILCFVLAYFNFGIFFIFIVGSSLYVLWTLFFMKKREKIDFEEFEEKSKNQSSLIQLLSSITEIKLNGSEQRRKNEWKSVQYRLFDVSIKKLGLNIRQAHGGSVINQMKNILIIFFAAKLVIDGSITLGTMLAIQFIIGSLENPIAALIRFFLTLQDANISVKRLSEIHNAIEENSDEENEILKIDSFSAIEFKDVSFRYGAPGSKMVLDSINLTIPVGKVTAIVGPSGSGKTTLLKLLLKFHIPTSGQILLNEKDINTYDTNRWRKNCGVVMQDGYIFDDSIKNNITESKSTSPTDYEMLNKAVKISNLTDLIEQLPNKIDSIVGRDGSMLSGGERQRILIARAIYKKPKYLFFDEATSSLDSSNEKKINEALTVFFKNKTVIVIAHRLSTVRAADQIIVMDSGKIFEIGNHGELTKRKGKYYELVKNQL